jgi:hypothetical protein
MAITKLYKYLDANGGLMMLQNCNLQFTNATQLNDPFDCHPALINFSNSPQERYGKTAKMVSLLQAAKHVSKRNKVWICSLSKVYDSLLMWSYYGNHQGICIGLDMEKADRYLSRIMCSVNIGTIKLEVQYKDIIEKPDYFHDNIDCIRYQLSTKAKDWEHEQEVRLLLIDPTEVFIPMKLPYKPKNEEKPIDWKEVRAYPCIGGECFDSLYLGVRMDEDKKQTIIESAKKCNPDIIIFEMTINPKAFCLTEKRIC